MKYKNKGFTLIEILAVVTIIGLIFILVIPKITTSLKNKKSDVDKTTENLVLSATKLYVSEHSSKFEKTDSNVSCMPLHQLVKKGYLDDPVKNVTDDKDITNRKSVRITYDKGFKYELVDSSECYALDLKSEGYKRVEYLESTGTQYIDTGIYPKSTTKVIFKFSGESVKNGWGSSGGAESFLWGGSSSGKYTSSVASYWKYVLSDVDTDDKVHVFELSSGSQKIDGIQYGTTTIGDTALSHQTLYFFANHVEWSSTPEYGVERIYSSKIYDGDILVRDFIAVIDSENIPCLFDKVEKKCYYNKGSGKFYYPVDMNDYTDVNYLESTGTQYIDTGIYPKSTTRVVFNFELKEGSCDNGWGSGGGAESYMWGTNGNGQYVSFVANDWTSSNTEILVDGKRHEFDLSSGHQKFDDVEYGTTQIGDTAITSQTLYLFATHVEWTREPNYWCKEKVFSVKIYDGNRIMRDYIPMLDKNNRPCLFDKVQIKCYYNQGTGEFLWG